MFLVACIAPTLRHRALRRSVFGTHTHPQPKCPIVSCDFCHCFGQTERRLNGRTRRTNIVATFDLCKHSITYNLIKYTCLHTDARALQHKRSYLCCHSFGARRLLFVRRMEWVLVFPIPPECCHIVAGRKDACDDSVVIRRGYAKGAITMILSFYDK